MPSAHPLTDHEEILEWAQERDAKPARVRGTGKRGDTGMIRLDFPGFSGAGSLQPITWGEWFKSFDENNLALLVQDRTARGVKSNFNKLVSRETAAAQRRGRRTGAQAAARGGRKTARKSKGEGAREAAASRKTPARGGRSAKAKTGARKSTKQAASGRTRSRAASRARSSGTEGAAATGAAKRRSRRA
jgi:hypothetical protein